MNQFRAIIQLLFFCCLKGGIFIAIYNCSIKIISRDKGKSTVATAAYRSGEKLKCEYYRQSHDYIKKVGVAYIAYMEIFNHFKIFIRYINNYFFNIISCRNSFNNKFVVLVSVVIKSNIMTVIIIDARRSNNRSA